MQSTQQKVITPREFVAELLMHVADFGLAGQEDQNAALLIMDSIEAGSDNLGLDVLTGLVGLTPYSVDGEHPSLTGHDRSITQEI
ncbi:hypothetical protein CRPA11_00180 [Pseudomonas aeruginosa]